MSYDKFNKNPVLKSPIKIQEKKKDKIFSAIYMKLE
jgi:hypothetical protein